MPKSYTYRSLEQ